MHQNERSHSYALFFLNLLVDIFLLGVICFVGYFLIGYYLKFEFLSTGYQDWIYQAFRVKSIQLHGITPWDNIWANGINYWRIYQYFPHLVASLVSSLLHVSAAKSIMETTAVLFIAMRVVLYLLLRLFKINKIVVFLALLLSYNIPQEWIAIKEYTIFFAAIYIPLYLAFYIKRHDSVSTLFILSALTGFAWNVHPVLGMLLTGLFGLTFITTPKKTVSTYFISTVLFGLSSAAFFVNYVITTYKFTSEFLLSPSFAKQIILKPYYGLSLPILIALVVSLVILITSWKYISKSVMRLIFVTLIFLAAVALALAEQLPDIVYYTQFFRGMHFVGTFVIVSFAFTLQAFLKNHTNKLFLSIAAALSAILIINAIQIASEYSGVPTNMLESPISQYFTDKKVEGSVFYENNSEASYVNPALRLSGSYNTHLLPSPLSLRFSGLLSNEGSFTGLSVTRGQLVSDYSTVLGVEYFVFSKYSHLTDLVIQPKTKDVFITEAKVDTNQSSYVVVKNTKPIHYAYIVDSSEFEKIDNVKLTNPTLNAETYAPWDVQVSRYADFLQSDNAVPVNLLFSSANGLQVELSPTPFKNPVLIIMQSFDTNWHSPNKSVLVEPTSLRYMKINLRNVSLTDLYLVNTWPSWYWPLQALSGLTALASVLSYIIYIQWKKLS